MVPFRALGLRASGLRGLGFRACGNHWLPLGVYRWIHVSLPIKGYDGKTLEAQLERCELPHLDAGSGHGSRGF